MLEFTRTRYTITEFDPFDIDVVVFDHIVQYVVVSSCTFRETWRVFFTFNRPETVARAKYFALWAAYLEYTPDTLPAFMDVGATATIY